MHTALSQNPHTSRSHTPHVLQSLLCARARFFFPPALTVRVLRCLGCAVRPTAAAPGWEARHSYTPRCAGCWAAFSGGRRRVCTGGIPGRLSAPVLWSLRGRAESRRPAAALRRWRGPRHQRVRGSAARRGHSVPAGEARESWSSSRCSAAVISNNTSVRGSAFSWTPLGAA